MASSIVHSGFKNVHSGAGSFTGRETVVKYTGVFVVMIYPGGKMKRIIALFTLCLLVITYAVPVGAAEAAQAYSAPWCDTIPQMLAAGEYEEGVVIAGIDMSKARKAGDPASALEEKELRADMEEIMTDDISITVIRRDDMTTAQLLELLASDESILFAEPNYIMSRTADDDTPTADDIPAEGASFARDMTSLQWSNSADTSLHGAGASGNYSMNVPGWPDGSNMDHQIIVAVIDDAVDFTNPDLAEKAYVFSPEQQAELGCDVHGYNATWESDGILQYYDGHDHGTHVAGIIAASWDGHGISGVGSDVRIVSVQNNSEDGLTSLINNLRAMDFIKRAKASGADIRICNCSWQVLQNSKALDAAVTELGESGIVTLFAAGNDAQDLNAIQHIQSTLADNPYAIIVASTDVAGNLSDFSCYGNGVVTLAAPGTDILSTVRTENYIPMMANENTFYEDFEDGFAALQIYQIDPETGEKINGTEGQIVNAKEAMGFEGTQVLKVPVDHQYSTESWIGDLCVFRIDFSGVEGLKIDPADSFGFVFGGMDEVCLMQVSDYEMASFGQWSHKGGWGIAGVPLDDEAIVVEQGPSLTLLVEANLVDEIYFDTVGMGCEKYPYGFKSGTSMACPAASGAAAVLASRHYDELTSGDGESAKKLAAYVRSSVRPVPALDGKVSTGGIIDLAVDEEASDPADQPAPDITDVSVSGTEVTLTGTGFGSAGGSVTVKKYMIGQPSAEVGSEADEWNDTSVTLSLDEEFKGIIEVELTAANGKKDTFVKFISKSSNLFEKDLNINSDIGEPFTFDAPEDADMDAVQMGDAESTGIMMPLDGKIYYMPVIEEVEKKSAYRSLYCYDPAADSWSTCPSYPEWVSLVSGAAYDGKLYVKGLVMFTDESGNIPYSSDYGWEPPEICVYSYTPGDDSWQPCSADEVWYGLTLFSTDEGLMLAGEFFGETEYENDYGHYVFRKYDPSSGAGEFLGALAVKVANPVITYAFGHVCMCNNTGDVLYISSGNLSEGEFVKVDTPLLDPNRNPDAFPESNTTKFSIAGDENQLVVIFSDIINGTGADTFILQDGESKFTPYEKRVSDAALFGPSAAIMDGRLYVLSSSIFEPDKRLFRTTLLTESEEEEEDVPSGGEVPTGDNSHPEIWIILTVFALLAMTGAVIWYRRKEER